MIACLQYLDIIGSNSRPLCELWHFLVLDQPNYDIFLHACPKVIFFVARLVILLPFDICPIKTCSNVEFIENKEVTAETGTTWHSFYLEILVRAISDNILGSYTTFIKNQDIKSECEK